MLFSIFPGETRANYLSDKIVKQVAECVPRDKLRYLGGKLGRTAGEVNVVIARNETRAAMEHLIKSWRNEGWHKQNKDLRNFLVSAGVKLPSTLEALASSSEPER